MLDLMRRMLAPKKPRNSGSDAKQRLKVLLVHDEIDLTPAQMERMKAEIMEVINRYCDVEDDRVIFRLTKESGNVSLVSNVPVRRVNAKAG